MALVEYLIWRGNLFLSLVAFLSVCSSMLSAQDITQTVQGKITERGSGQPVAGAQVVLLKQSEVQLSAVSNDQGLFRLENIPVGRYKLEVNHVAFYNFSTELFVQSAKAVAIDVTLLERTRQLEDVTISASGKPRYSTPGVQELSVEKTTRLAANYFDPVRVTTSFPGVVIANDQNNAIIVRGNSPDGLLWRLNGLDILNPNHLSNAGTLNDRPASNGGGVNILSTQMLGTTRFINGNYAPAYGNFQSAVVDMDLRESQSRTMEHTAQASLLGLDYASEGAIVQEKLSYTFNARYSTVGLLSQMGVDFGGEAIGFQDVAGQLVYRTQGNGVLKLFFIAGNSKNDFKARPEDEWEEDKDRFNIRYTGNTIISGLSFVTPLRNEAMLKTGVAYSVSRQKRYADFTGTPEPGRWDDFSMRGSLLSQYIAFSKRISPTAWLEIGNYVNVYSSDIFLQEIPRLFNCMFCALPNKGLDGTFETWQLATYAQLRKRFSEKWNVMLGVRGVKTEMYSTYRVEPRAELQFDINEQQALSLNYSGFSQLQNPAIYLSAQNAALTPTRTHHGSLNYSRLMKNDVMLRTTAYYQYLQDVPVEPGSTFSVLNLMDVQARGGLVNDGLGRNYGVDISAEKSFYDNFYFMTGGSVYQSEYRDGTGTWQNTRFNGSYTVNLAAGKEWSKSKRETRRSFAVDTRLLYLGGLYEMPILEYFSAENGNTVFYEPAGFTEKIPDYTRLDLRLSWRKHKPRYTRTLSLDIQNVLSLKNTAYHYYDGFQQKRVAQEHLGIIPILAYRVEF
jgi:hypothetical protein